MHKFKYCCIILIVFCYICIKLTSGVTGNTSDFGSGECRFESYEVNFFCLQCVGNVALQLGHNILKFSIRWSELLPFMWSRIKLVY